MISLVLFNNKGGVGKTTLTFNLAHGFGRCGLRVVLLDYDPQCNLTSIVLDDDELIEVWDRSRAPGRTVATCIELVRIGRGDIYRPDMRPVGDNIWLLPGELSLSRFEQELAESFGRVLGTSNERAVLVTTALERLAQRCGDEVDADLVLIDVGPSLGALNRAVMLATDYVVVPVAPDLFSLQGLKNVGPTLLDWREGWSRVRAQTHTVGGDEVPQHSCEPIGYVVQQHIARADRPVSGYSRWAAEIPNAFHTHVLRETAPTIGGFDDDPSCLAMLRHYASLVAIAQTARKPIFELRQADGIGGGQIQAVSRARSEFAGLVERILTETGVEPGDPVWLREAMNGG